MADANRASWRMLRESTFGTAATGAGGYVINPTGDSLGFDESRTNSQRIRSDLMTDASVRTGYGASGDINVEWGFGMPYVPLWAAALRFDNSATDPHDMNDATFIVTASDAADDAASTRLVEVSSATVVECPGETFTNAPALGSFVRMFGWAESANNGVFEVAGTAVDTITFVGGSDLTVEAAGRDIGLITYSAVLANGTASATTSGFTHATGWTTTPAVGDWIFVRNFVATGNGGFFRVEAADSTSITTTPSPTGGESGVAGIDIVLCGSLVNGTAASSFTIERLLADAAGAGSDLSDTFTGMRVGGLSLTIPADGQVTGSVSFLGANVAAGTAHAITDTTPASPTQPFNGVDNVESFFIGGTDTEFSSFSLTLNNNLRQRRVANSGGSVDSIGDGTLELTGSVTMYANANDQYAKALANTATSIAVVLRDELGLTKIMDVPRIRFGAPRRVAGGPNSDVMLELPWTAERDPSSDRMIAVAFL